jgi:CHAT domain-containing protein
LNLAADVVILSACNTAAGDGETTESLSGLARAFIYAGARSLMVSHWYVDAEASRRLIVSTVQAHKQNVGTSYAEAVRMGILKLVNDPEPEVAHPAFWAPFAVIGGK